MPKPVTPLVGCDVFITDAENRVLLIRRSDSGYWALPGGCNDLGESPAECAVRECREETGLEVKILRLLGVFSSTRYRYVHYPWRENEFCQIFFQGEIIGGDVRVSDESLEVAFFSRDESPPLSDGHDTRISIGFQSLADGFVPVFE